MLYACVLSSVHREGLGASTEAGNTYTLIRLCITRLKRNEREGLRAEIFFCFCTDLFPCWDIAKPAPPEVGFSSLAHEDTSEEIFFFFFLPGNAPDCTKWDVQLYRRNRSPSWAEPPSIPAHMNAYYSHHHMNQSKGEWEVLFYGYWLVQALGSSYTHHFLQFPFPAPLPIPPQSQSQSPSPVKAVRVTAGFSPVDPCQLQILIKRLCASTRDNLCLSPREVKMLWKEFLHGYGSIVKSSATPLGVRMWLRVHRPERLTLARQSEELFVHPKASTRNSDFQR